MSKKKAHHQDRSAQTKSRLGYTPKEKKIMIFDFAGLVVVLALIIWLPDFIRSFGLLDVKDGVVQGVEDNWLICDVGTSSRNEYRKLAEIGDIDGYELSLSASVSDENVLYHDYAPTGDGPAQTLRFMSVSGEASEMFDTLTERQSMFMNEVTYQSEPEELTINGRDAYVFLIEGTMQDYEAEAEAAAETDAEAADASGDAAAETAPEATPEAADASGDAESETTGDAEDDAAAVTYLQNAYLYIDSGISGHSVLVNAFNEGADESVFADHDAMIELVERAAQSVTVE